jgi:hypothetical protein
MRYYRKGQTIQISDKPFGRITGRTDVIFLKNKYQSLIDDKLIEVWNFIHRMEDNEVGVNWADKEVKSRRAVIKTLIDDENLKLSQLEHTLENARDDDKHSWDKTTDVLKEGAKSPTNVYSSRGLFETGVGPIINTPHLQFPARYQDGPMKNQENQLSFDIKNIRDRIIYEKQKYVKSVRDYDALLQTFAKDLIKVDEDLKKYQSLLDEGRKRISESRYITGIFYLFSSQENKMSLELDVTRHDVSKAKLAIDGLKLRISKYSIPTTETDEHTYSIF